MLKILKSGIIGASIILSLSGCQSELSNEEIKGLKACYQKPTGIALWSNDILQVTNNIKNTGIDISVLQNGSELTIDMGDDDKIVLEEIDYKNTTCYEVQSIQGKKGGISKEDGDNFLLVSARFFGRLSVTDGDKERWKEEADNRQNIKSTKMKEANKELEIAKLENKKFEEFLKEFNVTDFDNIDNITDAKLNSLKNLIVKNKDFNVSLFNKFISKIDYILNISENKRERSDLSTFSYQYNSFKSELASEASNFSYKITSIQDDISDINDRY